MNALRGPGLLVTALSAAFGVLLIECTDVITALLGADPRTGHSHTVAGLLQAVALVFLLLAVYTAAVVTTNTFSTIVAGRVRLIALRRLLGASARAERRAIAREGLLVGTLGATIGALAGLLLAVVGVRVAITTHFIAAVAVSYLTPELLLPFIVVILVTWLAAWIGSRPVLAVTPTQALAGAAEPGPEHTRLGRPRAALAIAMILLGVALLILGMIVGHAGPVGVLIGALGGILSFSGIVIAAPRLLPPALRAVGTLLGRSPTARLAALNAIRYPARSTRMTVGLLIGVTLITTFAVTMQTFSDLVARILPAAEAAQISGVLSAITAVFSALIGVSAVIAACGLIANLSMNVLQRTRELGLLRALGFSRRQLRRMILAESAQLVLTATILGLILGTVYGWIGAQSLLASRPGFPGLILPSVPWLVVVAIVVSAALLTVIASITPARRATRVSPVAALATE